jgi:glyoxylase-like metal-dependent hydrolase (beta-lactamase superfamily II)
VSHPAAIQIAPGVRRVTVGVPIGSHVYLIDRPEGVIAFDAGVRGTGEQILAAAGRPITRVVLSPSHVDHRGAAGELRAPVFCHPDEVADAEGDGGLHYADFRRIRNPAARELVRRLVVAWDGGPDRIAVTVVDGDEVGGFRVVHVPGHAPGLIALFRDHDGLLLAADAVYTLDLETGAPVATRVPHPAVNWDTTLARTSIRRLAALEPTSVRTGHSHDVESPVLQQLQRAAARDAIAASEAA